MFSKLGRRLTYANIVSTLALFLVLTGGTAVALSGSNTVFSDDIKDGEVRRSDVAGGAIAGGKVVDDSLTSDDVAGLTGGDVNDNSLTGDDVDETTFETVPSARELGIRGSDDFPTRVNSGQFGAADLKWEAEFLDTDTAADHSYPSVVLRTTGTKGQFKVCDVPGTEFTIYVNGTRTQHNTFGNDGCASTTFDPGERGDFEILARTTRIVGWDNSSLAGAEDYTTYALVGPFS